jgi:hypothetical protein
MVGEPAVGAEVVTEATPFTSVGLPRTAVPFLKVTFPFGVPPADVTVALKVTDWPKVEGFRLDESAVAVGACTTWVSAEELLKMKF